MSASLAVEQTKSWVEQIIVGLNFCPFAKKELVNNTILYVPTSTKKLKYLLVEVVEQCNHLHANEDIETTLVILTDGFKQFEQYLQLVDLANELIVEQGFEGEFQLASFHPEYCFEGEDFDDASNYTNRSPYPTIHIIREKSMEKVLSHYKNPEDIPEINITLARQKGANYFQAVLDNILSK